MLLKLQEPFLSLRDLSTGELPDLTILTGLNGSGKTHLLRSIADGKTKADEIPVEKIKYFDLWNFKVQSQQRVDAAHIINQTNSAWSFFSDGNRHIKPHDKSKVLYDSIFSAHDDKDVLSYLKKRGEKTSSMWEPVDVSPENEGIETSVREYTEKVTNQILKHDQYKNNGISHGLTHALKSLNKPFHFATEEEFRRGHSPKDESDNYLAMSLSAIFTKYKIDQFEWVINEFQKRSNQKSSQKELSIEYEKENPKPWLKIDELLREIHLAGGVSEIFDFSITNPEEEIVSISNMQKYAFVPAVIDNKTGEPRSFEDLSSGEKVLMALTLTTFASTTDFEFPELVLLDEVDASLHPSMTGALLATLEKTFVENGIKVILATHSPSAVSMCPENALHVIEKDAGKHTISTKSRRSAMQLIMEGYASLETGIAIFNDVAQNRITVISEGDNADIIEKACQLYNQNDVAVIGCFRGNSGETQLKTMYEFFKQAKHERPVLFVWDCDVNSFKTEDENTYGFILPKNEGNKIALRGIENVFPESEFSDFIITKTDSLENTTVQFDPSRKRDFKNHIVTKGKKTFAQFNTLIEKIEQIRTKDEQWRELSDASSMDADGTPSNHEPKGESYSS